MEEELKREARDKKEQGEGAGKDSDEHQDDAGGAQDADMYEYVHEDERSDAVAAGIFVCLFSLQVHRTPTRRGPCTGVRNQKC